jgi:hypothetical protein
MSIITRGYGNKGQIVTRGYASTLVVVVVPSREGWVGDWKWEPYYGPLIPGEEHKLIALRTIVVPDYKKPITVDVVLVKEGEQQLLVDAILQNDKYSYKDIKVYTVDEVEIL